MQRMRNSVIILAALLMATPTLAQEGPCKKVEPAPSTYIKYADTVHCFLRIDGKVIINRLCHVQISQQVREWGMYVDTWRVTAWMRHYYDDNVSDKSRRQFYAGFEDDDGRSLDYGRVEPDLRRNRQEHICFTNKRLRMCFSAPLLICDPPDL
jgi:hypothetical protein